MPRIAALQAHLLLVERPATQCSRPHLLDATSPGCYAGAMSEVRHNASAVSPAGALHGLVPCIAALQAPLTLLDVLAEGVALALSHLPL